jgi:hypothetical protein
MCNIIGTDAPAGINRGRGWILSADRTIEEILSLTDVPL